MARPERGDRRTLTTFLLVLLLCGILSLVHRQAAQRGGGSDPITGFVRDAGLLPGQIGAARFGQWWHVNVGSAFAGPHLARENTALKSQVAALTLQNEQMQDLQSENHRLRELLRFQDKAPIPLLAAEVVALKPSPQIDTMILARGARDGVHAQSVVLGPSGALVGQVLETSPFSCSVLLLTDTASSVGVETFRPGKAGPVGIVQGDRAGNLLLIDLPREADVRPGDRVATSGLGGVYPKGLPVGTVLSVAFDKATALKMARVRPAADFNHLDEAFLRLASPSPAVLPLDTAP
jgi:rod shape-determining protein MreC